MKKYSIIFGLLIAVIFAGTALASGCHMSGTSGHSGQHKTSSTSNEKNSYKGSSNYNINAQIDHTPPIVGINSIDITVIDNSGRAVKDAKVVVSYDMPSMPGMGTSKTAVFNGSSYVATINLSMAGNWVISVDVSRNGQHQAKKFAVDVR